MTASELADKLTVIADKARDLRSAGVVGPVTIDGVSFEVSSPEAVTDAQPQADDARGNVFDDPDLYGGHIPQRRPVAGPTSSRAENGDDD